MTGRACTYVTATWGVHDERWARALNSCGFVVETLSLIRDQVSIREVRAHLHEAGHPILAGPLLTVTKGLLDIGAPLYGLSWGYDLVNADRGRDGLSWLRQLAGLIVDSEHTNSIALRSGMDTTRIHRIPWGVDLETFTPEGPTATPTDLRIPAGSRIILSLRAFEPTYRVDDIIRAFAAIARDFPEVRLIMGNDGSLQRELQALTESLNIAEQVTFIGRVREDNLPSLLRAADVYITSSEVDGSSVTLLQAMACATPVIASNTPGNSEWIEAGRTGELFQVGAWTDLARTLRAILDGHGSMRASSLGKSARSAVEERADWARNSRQLEGILGT